MEKKDDSQVTQPVQEQKRQVTVQKKYLQNLKQMYTNPRDKIDQKLDRPHKFWGKQPVVNQETTGLVGPIDPVTDLQKVRKEPINLPEGFEWSNIDLSDDKQLDELYVLLSQNYVEDSAGVFRFDYHREFLRWSLKPPHQFDDWIAGIRWKKKNQLMACITGIPVTISLDKTEVKCTEINFLCIHKKLREKRIAPVLISEITRRVHMRNMWQAIYTSGTVLPTPFTQAQYFHRSLNPKKLIESNFSSLSGKMTMGMTKKLYQLPDQMTADFKPTTKKHIKQLTNLLNKRLSATRVHFVFSEQDVAHFMLPRDKLMYSYVKVVDGKVTDFFSFYSLPSHIINNPKHKHLEAAYCYYTVATSMPLKDVIYNALIAALKEGFDVFNCVEIMDHSDFLKELHFAEGGGYLKYYLYNWNLGTPVHHRDLGMILF